jgi:hypothetical protein
VTFGGGGGGGGVIVPDHVNRTSLLITVK